MLRVLIKGYPEDEAKGYGIWLAKFVASRRSGSASSDSTQRKRRQPAADEEPKFRSVGDEHQTDATFDHNIIDRTGEEFYETVFVPAIAAAGEQGAAYEAIRDEIRKPWKPVRSRAK